jgi:glutamate transport system substrate-binding protein
MRKHRVLTLAIAAVLALAIAACGGGDEEAAPKVESDAASQFEAGSTMAKLAEAGAVKVGVKIDQPGIGFRRPGADAPEGFDIEIAKIVAAKLGIEPDGIEWVETVSKNREPFLQKGTVDLVLASYSITDERREVVGQAGPYYVTGQQLLVSEEDKGTITGPEKLDGKKVCSVTGSTSIKTVEEEYDATPAPFATYSECVQQLLNGQVDAVTTDGAILLGYAAEQPDKLEVVGPEFSEERYGIGYKKDDAAMCEFLDKTLTESFQDGSWEKAFASTLGEGGAEAPKPPKLDPCPAGGAG